MRAIIINDKDARDLVNALKLTELTVHNYSTVSYLRSTLHISEADVKKMADELHRHFHYTIVKWLQDQGANFT